MKPIITVVAMWAILILPLYIAYLCDIRELDRQEKKAHQILRASRKWIDERERRKFLNKAREEIYAASERKSA